MPATPEDLLGHLDALGIETVIHRHPPLYTVEDSRKLRGDIEGGHCKNLFFKDKKGALWLVVTLEDADLDLKRLHGVIGSARLSFGKPDLLMATLGVIPGAVSPFALFNDTNAVVNVVLDEAMMAHDILNYHPLSNEMTLSVASGDLIRFIEACGHAPKIIALQPQ